jgi:hypothetical protein
MKKVKISKVSGGQAMRTDSMVGLAPREPLVGVSYLVLGESLTPGADVRQFITSMVQKVEVTTKGYNLTTLNSIYQVEVLEDLQEDSLAELSKEG